MALRGQAIRIVALLLTNLHGLATAVWATRRRAQNPGGDLGGGDEAGVGAILLAIGAGGALKQVLVSAGLSELLARLSSSESMSPILLAWLVAVCIRLATGSATVATITTAGIVGKLVTTTGAAPEWIVLAIGAGSVFFSHVNDPGFWLVKSYLRNQHDGHFPHMVFAGDGDLDHRSHLHPLR